MYSTSGDVFCEVMVSHRKGTAEYLKIVLAILAGVVLTLGVLMFVPSIIFLMILVWALIVFIIRLQKVEYEYTFTSGDLDIDKISGDFKRKRKMSISMDTIEIVAPEGSHELDSFSHNNYKVFDFSANDPTLKNYVIIGSWQNLQVKVLITPNEKMLDHMFSCGPRKVKRT
jgi:hypothetical protein